jgi:hypothetical protein
MVLQNALGTLPRRLRIMLDAALKVENDGQNMARAERRGERLTGAPRLPGRPPGS